MDSYGNSIIKWVGNLRANNGGPIVGRGGRVVALLAVTVLAIVSLVPNGGASTAAMPGSTILADTGEAGVAPAEVVPPRPAAPPVTTAQMRGTLGLGGWFVSSVLVILNATDDVGVATTWYAIDRGDLQRYVMPFSINDDANHTLEFYSIDRQDLLEVPKTANVRVDRNPPVFVAMSPQGIVTTRNFVLSWKAEDEASGIARYEVSVDGSPFASVGQGTSQPLTLEDGEHSVQVRVFDVAGNDDETEYIVHVDTFPLSATGPQGTLILALIFGVNVAAVMAVVILRRRRRS